MSKLLAFAASFQPHIHTIGTSDIRPRPRIAIPREKQSYIASTYDELRRTTAAISQLQSWSHVDNGGKAP